MWGLDPPHDKVIVWCNRKVLATRGKQTSLAVFGTLTIKQREATHTLDHLRLAQWPQALSLMGGDTDNSQSWLRLFGTCPKVTALMLLRAYLFPVPTPFTPLTCSLLDNGS
jgi:hypothetical protein